MKSKSESDLYTILIVDDDALVAKGVAMNLVQPGRRVIICHDIESGSIVVEQDGIDVVVADIRFGGDFSYQGLEFVDFVRKESAGTQVILMSGSGANGLEAEAMRRGAAGFLHKPFSSSELEKLLRTGPRFGDMSAIIDVPDLDGLFEGGMLRVNFQPIVTLTDRRAVGFEALTRVNTESLLRNPENLFNYAARSGRLHELDTYCLSAAIAAGQPLTRNARLFLNVHPRTFEAPSIVDTLVAALDSADLSPDRIVLEITEQDALRPALSMKQIHDLKNLGFEFAFDDIGVAFSHLPYMDEVSPRWIKISQLFGTDFERDPTKVKIVENLASLATSFDANLILEGVETEATALAAADSGIVYAQGYHFARPAPVKTWSSLQSGELPALATAVG